MQLSIHKKNTKKPGLLESYRPKSVWPSQVQTTQKYGHHQANVLQNTVSAQQEQNKQLNNKNHKKFKININKQQIFIQK